MASFSIVTMGCPKNQVDSGKLSRLLVEYGLTSVENVEDANLILVNTCGFIQDAKEESIEEILGLSRYRAHNRKLLVFGCLGERYKDELIREIPEIDALWGVGKETEVAGFCKSVSVGMQPIPVTFAATAAPHPEAPCPKTPQPPYEYLKIAEGCNRRCLYCAIPGIRGPLVSAKPGVVLAEAEEAVKLGKKELILVAQDLTNYGVDIGYTLERLIDDIASINGDFWLRLLYLYPTRVDEKLLDCFKRQSRLCNYFDIPLQHSEDRIIKSMGRAGGRKQYLELVRAIRTEIPDAVVRTTFIVGYPGEEEEDFAGLRDFVEEVCFDNLGVFRYSDEEGTPASLIKKKVPKYVKKRRFDDIMTLQSHLSLENNRRYVGNSYKCLIDDHSGDYAIGRMFCHAPEIDGNVIIKNPHASDIRGFVRVKIDDCSEYDLMGHIEP
ncbi:MAG: 30S ribosomal protein S12 methylthiotransferase RimO [Nitrospirae bacterium]|nr:30S ribosomal protein S12 methylthiotransferase RimO [Nitrospirota bacterium]